MDLNVAYDFSMIAQGYRIPIRWHDERQSTLCIIPRHGGKMRWVDIAPCFIQHVVNAHDTANGGIELHVVRYPWHFKPDGQQGLQPNPLGVLWRYTIDLNRGTAPEEQLGDLCVELPRTNET